MSLIKVKIDKSKLPDEFTFESPYIHCLESLNTEMGWSETRDAILERLSFQVEFIKEHID